MNSDPYLFLPVRVHRDDVVAACRRYIGLPYSSRSSFVAWVDDKPVGATNCLFLLLLVAEDVGFLPQGFVQGRKWYRRPRKDGERPPTRDEVMWELLHANCDEVRKDCMQPGDIIVERWTDMDAAKEHSHLALCSSMQPWPFRSKIHAIDSSINGGGCVEEVSLNALDWEKRILGVYRIRGVEE